MHIAGWLSYIVISMRTHNYIYSSYLLSSFEHVNPVWYERATGHGQQRLGHTQQVRVSLFTGGEITGKSSTINSPQDHGTLENTTPSFKLDSFARIREKRTCNHGFSLASQTLYLTVKVTILSIIMNIINFCWNECALAIISPICSRSPWRTVAAAAEMFLFLLRRRDGDIWVAPASMQQAHHAQIIHPTSGVTPTNHTLSIR